jgi:MFS family permease
MKPALSSLPAHKRPTRVRYGVLGFACALSMITYLDRVCIASAAPEIVRALGLHTISDLKMAFTAFAFAYAIFEIPSGWLGDVLGPRGVLIRIVLWWSVFTALTGAAGLSLAGLGIGLTALIVIRFLFGIGEAGAYPNITRALHNWFPFTERGFAQGAVWMAGRLMGGLTPLLWWLLVVGITRTVRLADGSEGTQVVLAPVLNWRETFWVFGACGVVWCVLFALWFRNRPEQKAGVNEAELALIRGGPAPFTPPDLAAARRGSLASPPSESVRQEGQVTGVSVPPANVVSAGGPDGAEVPTPVPAGADEILADEDEAAPAHAGVPWLKLVTSWNLWALCLMYFCGAYGWYFNITYLPTFLEKHYAVQADSFVGSLYKGGPLWMGAIACLVGGWLTDRFIRRTGNRKWGRRLFGVVGHSLCGLCYLACLWTPSAFSFFLAISLAAFWNDLTMGSAWATCQDIGRRYAAIVAGCMNTIGNLGGAAAGWATGKILEVSLSNYAAAHHLDPEHLDAAQRVAGQSAGYHVNFVMFAGVYFIAVLLWLCIDATRPVVEQE